ncbi:MAG: phosphatase PAP2 family protein [Yoonia sp.]|uniref:phosphatase PAP2 family protein n=1 Tax=Yoonia sp. TaxID=2212373 RepID=UPI003EF83F28
MRNLTFPLSCLAISVVAFGLMAASIDDALTQFWALGVDYGTGVALLVALLVPLQIIIAFIAKILQERGKDVSQADKIAWYKSYVLSYPWLNVASAILGAIVVTTSFTIYKALVVGSGGYGFDAAFIAWDRMFFMGHDGWVVTHRIFDTAAATAWLDYLYHPTFFPMLILYLISVAFVGLRALRQTYMLAFLSGFVVVGMVGANLLHSAGPIFDGVYYGDGSTFAPLIDRLQAQLAEGGGPIYADRARQYLLRLHELGTVQMGAGISAMPSMHMVFVFLWVFPAWHLNRAFGLVVAVYAAIIWIGSVHLGWHYFVDGLVSLALIGIVWRVAGHAMGLYGRDAQVMRATT